MEKPRWVVDQLVPRVQEQRFESTSMDLLHGRISEREWRQACKDIGVPLTIRAIQALGWKETPR